MELKNGGLKGQKFPLGCRTVYREEFFRIFEYELGDFFSDREKDIPLCEAISSLSCLPIYIEFDSLYFWFRGVYIQKRQPPK